MAAMVKTSRRKHRTLLRITDLPLRIQLDERAPKIDLHGLLHESIYKVNEPSF